MNNENLTTTKLLIMAAVTLGTFFVFIYTVSP